MKPDSAVPLALSLAAALALVPRPSPALDGAGVELGRGDDDTRMARAFLTWDWGVRWLPFGEWHVGGYWELEGGYWDGDQDRGGSSHLWEIGFTPMFRLERSPYAALNVAPFVEAGIGAHLLSENRISGRDLSTTFQFGDAVGLGVRLGKAQRIELGYRFQHLSNGSIRGDNDGINFHILRVAYRF